MPFKFAWICDLFQAVEDVECRDPQYLPDRKRAELRKAVEAWFRQHRVVLDRPDTNGVALLSTLLPQKRPDRVYSIKERRLEQLVARCLSYSTEKVGQLSGWRQPGKGDFGECLERIEKVHDCEPLPGPGALTVEQVDAGLRDLASRCRFSSPEAKKNIAADIPEQILAPLLKRMHSRDKKWFARLILKNLGRIVLDENLVLSEFHFMLPSLLTFQNDFAAAIALLKGPLARYHAKPDFLSQKLMLEHAAQHLKPRIGIKIGRPTWYKARSIKNCLQMVGNGTWIIERKYDGEFCEVHVDLNKKQCIQIFSKNGKDATNDRRDLLPCIRDSLRIGTSDCQFNSKCVLLGEMVVYNQLEDKVMDFAKIRKYVDRSGSFLGTAKDSQPHPHENLMIFFFDILLVDDEATLTKPHSQRRQRLTEVMTKIPGRTMTVEWKKLDFATKDAGKSLVYQFAASISYRCEGLILKPDAPYFPLAKDDTGSWTKGFIKIKKDYMKELGGERDEADFAVVGASYEVQQAQQCKQRNVRWTNFYLGCLVDTGAFSHERPTFRVVGIVKAKHCIPPKELEFLNQYGQFRCEDFKSDKQIEEFDIRLGRNPAPSVIFKEPLVLEVLGSSFEKPPNEDFYMFRHPRVLRAHTDRSWEDCVTMQGLADMAQKARDAPPEGESQETRRLVEMFREKMDRLQKREGLASNQTTPRSTTTPNTSSPLSTLKTIKTCHLVSGTPKHSAILDNARATLFGHPVSASIKTPSPATALKNANKNQTVDISGGSEFTNRATSLSQPSTQWTETIVTPTVSERQRHKALTMISPPHRTAVSGNGLPSEMIQGSRKASQARAYHEDSPCPDGQNTSNCAEPTLNVSHRVPKETTETSSRKRTRNPLEASDVRADAPELLFYERREALSTKTPNIQPLHIRKDSDAEDFILPGQKPEQALASGKIAVSHRLESAAVAKARAPKPVTGVDPMAQLSVRERKVAPDVISRTRSLHLTTSLSIPTTGHGVSKNSRTTDATAAVPILPPISMDIIHPLLTPPKSSPSVPLSEGRVGNASNIANITPTSSPNAQSVTSVPPTSAKAALKENIPPSRGATRPTTPIELKPTRSRSSPTISPGSRKRWADDFDIGATPRKIPKWRSSVYGLPALPSTTAKPVPAPKPPTLAPYNLVQAAVYLPPSLQPHARLRNELLSQNFGAVLVSDLGLWQRDYGTKYESMGSTVGESQAYPGFRKLVLVEPRKRQECEEVVDGLKRVGLGQGGNREVVELYDWRVVEDLVGLEGQEGEGREKSVWERRYWGRV